MVPAYLLQLRFIYSDGLCVGQQRAVIFRDLNVGVVILLSTNDLLKRRAVFTRVSKSNWCCVTSLPLYHRFFIQSEVEVKLIVIRWQTFSRGLRQLHALTPSFDWFTTVCALCDWLEC